MSIKDIYIAITTVLSRNKNRKRKKTEDAKEAQNSVLDALEASDEKGEQAGEFVGEEDASTQVLEEGRCPMSKKKRKTAVEQTNFID